MVNLLSPLPQSIITFTPQTVEREYLNITIIQEGNSTIEKVGCPFFCKTISNQTVQKCLHSLA